MYCSIIIIIAKLHFFYIYIRLTEQNVGLATLIKLHTHKLNSWPIKEQHILDVTLMIVITIN